MEVNDYQSFFPSNWSHSNAYEKVLYILEQINIDNWEFQQLKLKFNKVPVTVYRVQHPIGFLRYKVQTEYLQFSSQTFQENFGFMSVEDNDLETFLNYSCDQRFIDFKAESVMPNSLPNNIKNLVVIRNRNSAVDTDKNHYPMYLIKF